MTREEEAFIQGIEMAKDFHLHLIKEDMEEYERLIKRREEKICVKTDKGA